MPYRLFSVSIVSILTCTLLNVAMCCTMVHAETCVYVFYVCVHGCWSQSNLALEFGVPLWPTCCFKAFSSVSSAEASSSSMAQGTAESLAPINTRCGCLGSRGKILESWWQASSSLRGAEGSSTARTLLKVTCPLGVGDWNWSSSTSQPAERDLSWDRMCWESETENFTDPEDNRLSCNCKTLKKILRNTQ